MGTGTGLRVEPTQPTVKLAAVDEEKLKNIVEICNVSRDEALRVLDACHMDETMAIERFLSGKEISTWSEVSKKKKPVPHPRGSAPSTRSSFPTYNSRPHDRDRDRDRDRRDRDRYNSDAPSSHRRQPRQHGASYSQKNKDPASSQRRSSPPDPAPADLSYAAQPTGETWGSSAPAATDTWADPNSANAETWGETLPAQTEQWGEPALPTPQSDSAPSTAPAETAWGESSQTSATASAAAWGRQEPVAEAAPVPQPEQQLEPDTTAINSSHLPETTPQQPVIPASTVKRTFNYAAAAAAGTSHAKPAPVATDMSASAPITSAPPPRTIESDPIPPTHAEDVASTDSTDLKKRRNRGGRKTRARPEGERPPLDTNTDRPLPATSNVLNTEPYESRTSSATPSPGDVRVESPAAPTPNAWGARPSSTADTQEEKHLEDNSTAVAVASAAVVGSEPSTGDSLSLQFGSFGLSGLDGVNWSATEQKPVEPVSTPIIPPETTSVAASAVLATPTGSTSTVPAAVQTTVGITPSSMPSSTALDGPVPMTSTQEARTQSTASSAPAPAASTATSGSGIFPILPVAPGGNFPPPNYGAPPYLMPPLHGYSPALGSYENGADLGSSRAPNLGPPGALPLYDPATLSGMASGNGKYAGIPGLGDMSSLQGVQSGVAKDGLHINPGEMEKSNSAGTAGLPAGMDPLAAPYMMPGYPSMQYPMYTFPTAQFAPPPGMAPPGPSPFPYAPTGQVSSQGGRGGFGFDDGSVGLGANSRNGSGLGESMYTPGGYLNTPMTHSGSQKAPNEGSYKQVRGNHGNGLGGMGMTGGIVHGMTYSDYSAGIPGGSNGVGGNGGGPAGWNNRQANGGRGDSSNGPGVVSNQSMAGASPNSSVYAAGPGGAPGGYWPPQQAGYYP